MKFRTVCAVFKYVAFHLFCLNLEGCPLSSQSFTPRVGRSLLAFHLTLTPPFFPCSKRTRVCVCVCVCVCACVFPFVYICHFGLCFSTLKSPNFFCYVIKGYFSFRAQWRWCGSVAGENDKQAQDTLKQQVAVENLRSLGRHCSV